MSHPNQTISTDSLLQESRTFPPPPDAVKRAHINAETYNKMYAQSVNEPEKFWLEQAKSLDWS